MKRVVFAIFLFLACVLPVSGNAQQSNKSAVEQLQKLNRFYRYLSGMYVDSLDMKPIVETAIKSMLSELDPHSAYLDKKEMDAARESTEGEFSGIGVEYNIHNDSIMVVNTIAQGPADRVGLWPNDRIVEIDGANVVGIKREDVPPLLRGPRGSIVAVGVVRKGVKEKLSFIIERDNIPITTVDAAYIASKGVGYIKVNRFGRTTMDEFRAAMAKLSGIEALILDLGGNGGGLLNQAIDLAGYFLPQDNVVVSVEGRALETERLRAKKGGEFGGRMVVIIDEGSASGSELVAGALQDWDRAVIVGRDSYGKGLVQREIPMGDGSAIRLTVARYHTPSGRVIQRPYEKGHKDDYDKAYIERLRGNENGELSDDRPVYQTLRSRRTVYGGGGIQPDVYVHSDTTRVSDYMVKIVAQGVYNEFILDYMDRNRKKLEAKYPTFAKFNESFEFTDEDMKRLVNMATSKGVDYDEAGYNQSQMYMCSQLAALVAQRLYGVSESYQLLNPRLNNSYIKALEIIENWTQEGESILNPKE